MGGPACVAFLAFYWLLASGLSDGDRERPVTSDDRNQTRAGITRGVVGRVTAADGRPVWNAWIQARSLDRPSPPIPDIAVLTNTDGWYTWPLSPGTYELLVSAEGYQRATKRITVGASAAARLDFTLE